MRYLKKTEEMDFKGYLIVTPYYNLPSQYGMYEHYATLANETKKEMKAILGEIQDGTFKQQFADENATDAANLKEMRAAEERETIETVGKRLRIACGLQKED